VTGTGRFRTILVPIDFSDCSRQALDLARSLTRQGGPTHLILIHAYFVPVELEALAAEAHEPILEVVSQHATKDLDRLLVELRKEGISAELTAHRGSPERAIVEVAIEKEADLIVMGTHGRSGLAHVLLGSVAERVVRTAPCPVITIKSG
jgi:universal stress protein A